MLQFCVIKIDGYAIDYQLTGDQFYRDDCTAHRHRSAAGLATAYTLPALLREQAPFTESVQAMCRTCAGYVVNVTWPTVGHLIAYGLPALLRKLALFS